MQVKFEYRIGDIVQIVCNGDIGTVVGLMVDEHDDQWARIECKSDSSQQGINHQTHWYRMDAIEKITSEVAQRA